MIDPTGMSSSTLRMALQGLPARLIQDGILSDKSALQALDEIKASNTNLVTHLVTKGLADPREIAIASSQEFGVPLLDLDAVHPDLDVIRLVSNKLLQKHRVLPLAKRGKRLFVAVSDPTNTHALDEIKFQTSMSVEPIVVEENKLQKLVGEALEQVESQISNLSTADVDLDGLDINSDDETVESGGRDDIDEAPIVRFVNKMLLDAIKKGASDIHFEPYEKIYRIRLRIDGYLKELSAPPVQLANKLAARIKVLARLDIAERRIPQDGRIKLRISKTRAIDFRVSTCPTLFGEKIVARILDPSSAMMGINALGYEPFQKELYLQALARPHGMILVTGPTGSGKTVSLYTGLNILNKEDTNISTAEDPAEINLPGVNQVNINPKVGLTFASALRAFLRQDPDVIMVGEIRDLETAEIAIKASQTGHLVLSTLHTNDAPKTLSRLVDMGVQPYAIATSVSLIIAQRLARKLCEHCKERLELPPSALLKEGFTEAEITTDLKIYKPTGCNLCSDGYKGRIGIYQVMPVTEAISRIILRGGDSMEIADQAAKEGIWDLRRSALEKVKNGITSLDELHQCTVE